MKKVVAAAAMCLAFGASHAAIDIYTAGLLGSNEVGAGDPDGYGGATVMIDNLTNTVTWSLFTLAVDPLTLAHIHKGAAGVNGPVIIDFNAMPFGTLVDADAAMINPGNAMGFYVNLHTAAFPGGAVRGQLMWSKTINPPIPEPSTYALMLGGLAGVMLLARRRKLSVE